ncbi:MAG: TadE/TadG family type IV pilus assembly protein [Chloroflexota bacterium]
MRLHNCKNRRLGAAMAETGLVMPFLVLVIVGLIATGLMVFRYQQMATLAREGARWASVHGADYRSATGSAATTAADVYNNAILPLAVGLDTSKLTYTVVWSDSAQTPAVASTTSNPPGQPVASTVTVTVNYATVDFWGAAIRLSGTSVVAMQY